jgi:hypothetical protein
MSGHKDREGQISKYDMTRPDPTLALCRQKRIRCCGASVVWDTFSGGNVTTAQAIWTSKG